eukprot:CAMPEP_0174305326 /NCGR_PEP_ID=MMETSP0809-20121228/61343_1 /TAXON_ID=73025 ORGANISM="Eutreptiella gymnastica-like, Strain CCMP1594" /NCGR_SAMPLE_ID=MMETSP0809 /ASSEMBLY_ACC=CAM_ASM_000658 /LENGTH=58 /DNA_ID=CAMNT_0015411781 /DNA_START=1419 /DNA_END=1595 /DNA_ORIENTATION=+
MTLQHRNEAHHQDRGGQRNWVQRDVRQTDADGAPAKQDTPKGSSGASPGPNYWYRTRN